MRTTRHINFAWILVGSLAFVFTFFIGCQRPYSPAVYRAQDESQMYAMICHDNKRTLRVPAEEWKAHRAHGDYRGPCRTRKLAGKKTPEEVKHTLTSYENAKPRAADSYERWAEKEAIKEAYIDSLKAVHEISAVKKKKQ